MAAQTKCNKGVKCPHVKTGNCRFSHPPCRNGVNCPSVKLKKCGFYHPPSHFNNNSLKSSSKVNSNRFPSPSTSSSPSAPGGSKKCRDGMKCKLVKQGKCPFGHTICKDGIQCKLLKTRSCGYRHPKDHFIQTAVHSIANRGVDDEKKDNDPAAQRCTDGMKCALVRKGKCPFGHTPCKDGIKCKLLKKRSCGYRHSPDHFLRTKSCEQGTDCPFVRQGSCYKIHPECKKRLNCENLKKRNCGYYHPRDHFKKIESRIKMKRITVFLNLGMQGLGTKTFQAVDLEDTLDSFLDMVKDKEGAMGVEWIRTGTKVLTGTQFGSLKLADLGFYNEITLWASLRLHGGAEEKSQFDVKKIQTFGGSVKNSECNVCLITGMNVTLECGDSYCSSCMKHLISNQTKSCAAKLSCISCKKEIDSMLAFEIATFTAKEKAVADNLLFRNGLKLPESMMSECVHCKEIVMKQPKNGNKLSCHKCGKYTCQICKLSWINPNGNNKQFCGNDVCDPSTMYQTFLDFAKDKSINGVMVTNTRFCPKCLKVNIHAIACKHITCPCGHQYCHVCLQDWFSHEYDKCNVHPTQKITKEMIMKLSK